MPGGTIKRGEMPIQAAERELLEETAIAGGPLLYLFEFGGITLSYSRHTTMLNRLRAARSSAVAGSSKPRFQAF